MANLSQRNSLNVPGPWYVDGSCTACGVCASLAPSFFKLADDGSTAFVYRQPAGPTEEDEADSAMIDCPAEAIGRDG
jgi:ferredoxin